MTSTIPSRACGVSPAMAIAAARSSWWTTKKPPTISFASANGPSVTSVFPPRLRTRARL
jgi:hypothetical protein